VEKSGKCCLCGGQYGRYGHNPSPLGDVETERCCDDCNQMYVLGARLGCTIDPMRSPEQIVRRTLLMIYSRTTKK
jgi:hypothetical protein